jgi:hypothetical protein
MSDLIIICPHSACTLRNWYLILGTGSVGFEIGIGKNNIDINYSYLGILTVGERG